MPSLLLMALVGGLAIYQMQQGEGMTTTIRDNAIPCIQMAGSMESMFQRKRILVMSSSRLARRGDQTLRVG